MTSYESKTIILTFMLKGTGYYTLTSLHRSHVNCLNQILVIKTILTPRTELSQTLPITMTDFGLVKEMITRSNLTDPNL